MSTPANAEERHATWLELFFDLVIVAAVAQLAHLLHEDVTGEKVVLFAFAYYAMWSVWTAFTLYANVSGIRTRQRSMLLAMLGIAVMAASIPIVERGTAGPFVIAYLCCRLLSIGSFKRENRVMTEWPGVQQAIGVLPWVASLALHDANRYWFWAAGIALDLYFSLARSRDPQALLAEERRELERSLRRRHREQELDKVLALQAATPDRPHLGERLGLFVIIVLGEAVAQLVNAAADVEHWRNGVWLVVVLGFGLLVALWWLTLRYGPSAAPTYGMRVFALRLTMPAHYLTTVSIVVIAAGLGAMAGHPDGHVETSARLVLCSGAVLYFLIATLMGARGGASWRWVLGWGVPAVLVCAAAGVLGGPLPAWALLAVVLAAAGWHIAYRRVSGVRGGQDDDAAEVAPSGDQL
ncbi:low temperature requirement protein A [Dactylosporangium sp. NPDC049140]|jgi:low temperature requirement protein LtrA|uniref:low temperature requirement protein A n=1 Tax=Dactylosporangium sp. NPDC049140 TaxID=3155647 RepID=UPI0033D47EF0